MIPTWKYRVAGILCAVPVMFTQMLNAAGFILQEQSISGLGVGFASGAAGLSDNSSMYFNPATLTLVNGTQVSGGLHVILPKAEFRNNGSSSTYAPTRGPDATSDKTAVVPNLYISRQVSDDLVVGVAMTSPFGLATSYQDDWVGRYLAVETELTTLNTNLAFGYKISDGFALGGGFSICYGDAMLSNALNLGLTFLQDLQAGDIPATTQTLAIAQDLQNPASPALGTTKYDGHAELSGDAVGYGFNLGILMHPGESTRIGLHYRSKVKLDLEGNASFTVGLLAPYFESMFVNQAGMVELELPDTAQISMHQYMTEKWAVMADITHTWWSSFDELNIRFRDGMPPNVIPENWKDVWRYSVGSTFQVSPGMQLRGGLVIDESPVPGDKYRSPRIPDEDRLWISFGIGYQLSDQFRLDVAYVHVFVDDPVIDNDTHTDGEHLKGSMDAKVDLFSLGGSYSF